MQRHQLTKMTAMLWVPEAEELAADFQSSWQLPGTLMGRLPVLSGRHSELLLRPSRSAARLLPWRAPSERSRSPTGMNRGQGAAHSERAPSSLGSPACRSMVRTRAEALVDRPPEEPE